jgi:hypothetical protein
MLKAVGYWRPLPKYRNYARAEDFRLPDPTLLTRPEWCREERHQIASYLESRLIFIAWGGFSYCRFECDVARGAVGPPGTCCLTDGEWLWPEGLVHYIEKHHVMLPEEFIATMKRNDWRVEDLLEEEGKSYPNDAGTQPRGGIDFSFWIDWGEANSMKHA